MAFRAVSPNKMLSKFGNQIAPLEKVALWRSIPIAWAPVTLRTVYELEASRRKSVVILPGRAPRPTSHVLPFDRRRYPTVLRFAPAAGLSMPTDTDDAVKDSDN